jgi:hypothetical protein
MPLQNVRDRAASEFVSQIGQCALNPPVTPIAVFLGHLNDNLLDLGGRAWPPAAACSAPIVFGERSAVDVDHLKLALIHPSGKRNQCKPERIEDFRHLVASLSKDRPTGPQDIFKKISFSGP